MDKLAELTDAEARDLMLKVMMAIIEHLNGNPAVVALVIASPEGIVRTFSYLHDSDDESRIGDLLELAAAKRREHEGKRRPL